MLDSRGKSVCQHIEDTLVGQNTETIGSSSAKQMDQINLIKITLLLPATMHVLKSWPCLLPASEPDELIAALEPQASTCSKYQHVGPNLHVVFIRYASWTELVSRAAYCDIHTMQLASVSNKWQHRWAWRNPIEILLLSLATLHVQSSWACLLPAGADSCS